MPRATAEEAHPDWRPASRTPEELAGQAHRVAEPESEQPGIKGQGFLVVGRGEHDMTHPLGAGDEGRPVRADGRPAVERRAAEDLHGVAGRVVSVDEAADSAVDELGRVAALHRYPSGSED